MVLYSNIAFKHTHTHLTALFLRLPRCAGTRKAKPIWILLKQKTVTSSVISWATCKSAPCSRQTNTPAPHHSVFYRPNALPAIQPTASKHWRQMLHLNMLNKLECSHHLATMAVYCNIWLRNLSFLDFHSKLYHFRCTMLDLVWMLPVYSVFALWWHHTLPYKVATCGAITMPL